MYVDFPAFEKLWDRVPTDILWRYMNVDRFTSMLETRSLWFSRLDEFNDRHEGHWYDYGDEQPGSLDMMHRHLALESTTANCWRADESLSPRAWREYTCEKDGIAIKTDVASLKASLNGPYMVTLVPVTYADGPADANYRLFDTLAHIRTKSAEYAWEQEVRIFDVSQHTLLTDLIIEEEIVDAMSLVNVLSRPLRAKSDSYRVDLSAMVKEIHLSPSADDELIDVVRAAACEHGLQGVPIIAGC